MYMFIKHNKQYHDFSGNKSAVILCYSLIWPVSLLMIFLLLLYLLVKEISNKIEYKLFHFISNRTKKD